MSAAQERRLKCPSAQPDMDDAQILGVVTRDGGTARVAYAAGRVDPAPDLLEATGPVPPTLVYRFAAACAASSCAHFDGARCRLAGRVAEQLDPGVERLPPCSIRRDCRWYAEQGEAVCLRCPEVVTWITDRTARTLSVAGPGVRD